MFYMHATVNLTYLRTFGNHACLKTNKLESFQVGALHPAGNNSLHPPPHHPLQQHPTMVKTLRKKHQVAKLLAFYPFNVIASKYDIDIFAALQEFIRFWMEMTK